MLSQRILCILWMTLASSCHYVGYELARTATFALFTSPRYGFSNSWAVSLATACVSPCSLLLLWLYTRLYDSYGPRRTVLLTCLAFAGVLLAGGIGLSALMATDTVPTVPFTRSAWTSCILFALFAVQNAMVYLLSTQHWSFLGSVVSSPTETNWVAGVGSVFSTFGGMAGGSYSSDLTKLLFGAGICLVLSSWCGDRSYVIAEKAGLMPSNQDRLASFGRRSVEKANALHSLPLLQRATKLFQRVPVLGWLCIEVFFYQCQSSLLNFLFVMAVKDSLVNDADRAKHTASTYALINLSSGLLQFICLPLLSSLGCDFTTMWIIIPGIMSGASMYMNYAQNWSLFLISASFVTMKTLEYSLRHSMIEAVYTSLDQESRFVGKEIIAMFANRFGKSLVALVLAIVNLLHSDALPYIRMNLLLLCVAWGATSYQLMNDLSRQNMAARSIKNKKE